MTQQNQQHTITVFGSGHPQPVDADYEAARRLGAELARRGFRVCTGGYGGVMEAALRGAKEAGGRTLAVTTKAFGGTANAWVDEELSMESWQARLFGLIRAGDGYVVCKGGTGTLAELAVVWEMLNKGVMERRPLVVLGEFWAPAVRSVIDGEADHLSPKSASAEATSSEGTSPTRAPAQTAPSRGAPLRRSAAGELIEFAAGAREAAERLARSLDARRQGDTRVAPR